MKSIRFIFVAVLSFLFAPTSFASDTIVYNVSECETKLAQGFGSAKVIVVQYVNGHEKSGICEVTIITRLGQGFKISASVRKSGVIIQKLRISGNRHWRQLVVGPIKPTLASG